MKFLYAFGALVALFPVSATAQTLTVEGVASPAWLERGGSRMPLAVGMRLADRDRIVTGTGARALLRMAEGSAVKLGENAVLAVDGLADRKGPDVGRLITASLDVARGAFRFTTDIFGKRRASRDVKIRITTITAGIRGTDVWGKSDQERDLVCLIEGRIAVNHPQAGEFTMADPLSFFVAPRKAQPLPIAPVDPRQLKQWAAETEIAPGSGAARRGGRYHVDASAAPDQKTALAEYDKLLAAGYPALIRPVKKEDGSLEYRVRIENLPTRQDAGALVKKLKALGMAGAVISN